MKIVHVTPNHAAPYAYCGHRIQYLRPDCSGSADKDVGWAVREYMDGYDTDNRLVWRFCEDCLESPDYVLWRLAEVG